MRSVASLSVVVTSLVAVVGCQHEPRGTLSAVAFPLSSLPKHVSLAPSSGSDKMPWMTSNPFLTADRHILAEFEKNLPVQKGSLREIYMAAYWAREPDESVVEIGLLALRFKDAVIASETAKTLQSAADENASAEPHTTPAIGHRGSTVCMLTHTSAVTEDTWSAMLRLFKDSLVHAP